ncbi:MAG: transposase family protein, partial [candidate division WOR-3 bacterium]
MKTLSYGVCPKCGESTNKVHQYKARLIDDIPIQNKRLRLNLRQRRFKCASCGKVFTERFES